MEEKILKAMRPNLRYYLKHGWKKRFRNNRERWLELANNESKKNQKERDGLQVKFNAIDNRI